MLQTEPRTRPGIAARQRIWLDDAMEPSRRPGFVTRLLHRGRSARRSDVDRCPDFREEREFLAASERCRPFTMTSLERMYALWQATRHVVRARIEGDLVECGVWKGGSSMLAALALRAAGDRERALWLYDTFTGMSEPTAADVDLAGRTAAGEWETETADGGWCEAPLAAVQQSIEATGHPRERLHFIVGKVEETIPVQAPAKIALLRLDTDWYESTRHELVHLWPRLSPGGVLIIDDYGHWRGARRAVDEYFADRPDAPLLSRVDYTGRVAVKRPS
jgi:hypothetical protein